MNDSKTGAIICKTPDLHNQFSYRPLVFITDIPDSYTDSDLRDNLDLHEFDHLIQGCADVLFRADLHSTTNEVQEEFEYLHEDSSHVPRIQFKARNSVM